MVTPHGNGSARPESELPPRNYIESPRDECGASRHGTAGAYTKFGCRCPAACRDKKWQEYERAHGRPMTVDVTGTIRRIRALQAIGWTGRQIMAESGWPGASLGAQVYQQTRVYRATAERIAEAYQRLSAHRGPSRYTRTYARNKGWLPPLAWDDETIDDPAHDPQRQLVADPHVSMMEMSPASGSRARLPLPDVDDVLVERVLDDGADPLQLNRSERVAAVLELNRRHLGRGEIANRLRMSGSRVAVVLDGRSVTAATHTQDHHDEQREATG